MHSTKGKNTIDRGYDFRRYMPAFHGGPAWHNCISARFHIAISSAYGLPNLQEGAGRYLPRKLFNLAEIQLHHAYINATKRRPAKAKKEEAVMTNSLESKMERFREKRQRQGAQILRNETCFMHVAVTKDAAQRSIWTFYGTV